MWTSSLPVDVIEAKLTQTILPHLEKVCNPQLAVRARLTPQLVDVRAERLPKRSTPPPRACRVETQVCILNFQPSMS